MTSHKSLNKKKGAAYAFFSALKTVSLPAVMLSAVLIFFMDIMTFAEYHSHTQYSQTPVKEAFKFIAFSGSGNIFTFVILAVVAFLSISAGIVVFKFASDKRTVNVYYSLGIKRSVLYYSRLAAGGISLCAAVMLPVIINYMINLFYVGGSWQLSLVLIYYYFGLSLFALLCYTVTAAVFASVGTVSEGVVFSTGLLAAPTVFFFSLESLATEFLTSSAYNSHIVKFTESYYDYDTISGMIVEYAAYNPLLFLLNGFTKFGMGRIDSATKAVTLNSGPWVFPDVISVLPWFFVAVLAAVAGGLLFKYRKAENCGFLNTNRVLSNLFIFELMIFPATLFVQDRTYTPLSSMLISGAVAAIVVYIACEIFLKRNVSKILKSLYKLPAHLVVIAIIFGIFLTGGLGYDSYIPNKNQVSSVAVSLPVWLSPYSLKDQNMWSYGGYSDFVDSYYSYYSYELPEMTASEDIDKVLALHKTLIEDESEKENEKYLLSSMTIRYTLKDGTEKKRCLSFAGEEITKKVLALTDTQALDNAVSELLTKQHVPDVNSEDNSMLIEKPEFMFNYDYSKVTAVNHSFSNEQLLNLTEQEFAALKQAVLTDLLSMSAEDMYYGDIAQYGVLRFRIKNSQEYSYPDSENYFGEDVSHPVGEITPPIEDETLTADDEILPGEEASAGEEQAPDENKKYSICDEISEDLFNSESQKSFDFIVTSKSVNTLAFLKNNGFDGCFDSGKTIKSISFAAPTAEYINERSYSVYDVMHDFTAKRISFNYGESSAPSDVSDFAENTITDTAKINEISSLLSFYRYTFCTGYYCLVEYTDGTCVREYLSENLAPDYVKNYNYEMYKSY